MRGSRRRRRWLAESRFSRDRREKSNLRPLRERRLVAPFFFLFLHSEKPPLLFFTHPVLLLCASWPKSELSAGVHSLSSPLSSPSHTHNHFSPPLLRLLFCCFPQRGGGSEEERPRGTGRRWCVYGPDQLGGAACRSSEGTFKQRQSRNTHSRVFGWRLGGTPSHLVALSQ